MRLAHHCLKKTASTTKSARAVFFGTNLTTTPTFAVKNDATFSLNENRKTISQNLALKI